MASEAPHPVSRPRRTLGIAAQVAGIVGIVLCLLGAVGVLFGRGWAVDKVDQVAGNVDAQVARAEPLLDTAATKVGRTVARFSTSLSTRPSTAVVKPISSCAASSTLPKMCDSGSQRYWTSSARSRPSSSIAAASYSQQSCGSSTPFGCPVVPDV